MAKSRQQSLGKLVVKAAQRMGNPLALGLHFPALQDERKGNLLLLLQVCLHHGGTCFSVEKGPVTLEDAPSIWLELEAALGSAPAANREFDIHQDLSAV